MNDDDTTQTNNNCANTLVQIELTDRQLIRRYKRIYWMKASDDQHNIFL